jgi:hypothetical protein
MGNRVCAKKSVSGISGSSGRISVPQGACGVINDLLGDGSAAIVFDKLGELIIPVQEFGKFQLQGEAFADTDAEFRNMPPSRQDGEFVNLGKTDAEFSNVLHDYQVKQQTQIRKGDPHAVLQGNSHTWVLLFNAGQENEGLYTFQTSAQSPGYALAFESLNDAQSYVADLREKDFGPLEPFQWQAGQYCYFCDTAGFEGAVVPQHSNPARQSNPPPFANRQTQPSSGQPSGNKYAKPPDTDDDDDWEPDWDFEPEEIRKGNPRKVLQKSPHAWVILFNLGQKNEGVYTLSNDKNSAGYVVGFERKDDANNFCDELQESDELQDRAQPDKWSAEELVLFCESNGFEAVFAPKRAEIQPPSSNAYDVGMKSDNDTAADLDRADLDRADLEEVSHDTVADSERADLEELWKYVGCDPDDEGCEPGLDPKVVGYDPKEE